MIFWDVTTSSLKPVYQTPRCHISTTPIF